MESNALTVQNWDLHVHTNWSDGSMAVEDVVDFAAQRGLAGIAICDHDSMEMVPRARARAAQKNLRILPAVELSLFDEQTGRKVHLLVYDPPHPDVLMPLFETMAARRRALGEQMLERFCAYYPIEREQVLRQASQSGSIYRVHLLRALLEYGYCASVYALYSELFDFEHGVCPGAVQYPELLEGARLARESGGALVLAHPGVYNSFDAARRLGRAGLLDGLEYRYPRRKDEQMPLHNALVEELSLLTTGGTDFHGYNTTTPRPIGSCVTTQPELERLHNFIAERKKKR